MPAIVTTNKRDSNSDTADFLFGGGAMGERIRAFDWAKTSLGPITSWPSNLRTCVSTALDCAFPIIMWWGPELIILYNDEYAAILGPTKHPSALGERGDKVWPEIWDVIGPMLSQVMETAEATRSRDLLLHVNRGYPEEAYFSFSYSPIYKENGKVGGIFCPVIETTEKVIGERRLRTLRDVAAGCKGAESEQSVYESAAKVLAANSQDVPFAVIYRVDRRESIAHLKATAGIEPGAEGAPWNISLQNRTAGIWSLSEVAQTCGTIVSTDLSKQFVTLPTGAWNASAHTAMILPMVLPGQEHPRAIMVAAVSPMRALDEGYRTFFGLIATQIVSGLADAEAWAEERRRAEALAEIDRAKTAFFSNVSHEFRTPLTLMMGPVEETLADADTPSKVRKNLEVSQRNSLRLLKLVNSLLDFSRIEAGRIQAAYEPTEAGPLTAELASNFRSACERAGLKLTVHCDPVTEPVYLDHEMWEKIVLNLISNAFKYTPTGEIEVCLRSVPASGESEEPAGQSSFPSPLAGHIELAVRDTGIGIAEHELPNIFQRFYRVEGAGGRTHEGTGIGLSLVQELVKLHGGAISVESAVGQGTTFTVRIPVGSAHLPADRIRASASRTLTSTGIGANAYVEEALRWSPEPSNHPDEEELLVTQNAERGSLHIGARIVVADDNADMRDYVRRLLARYYRVEAVADGAAALAAARRDKPALLLIDVMMPVMDGFQLLEKIREDESLKTVPVILLSARAGEESKVEGLAAGADDYLVKPFAARELLARVDARLEMARMRQEVEDALRESSERLGHKNAELAERVAELKATTTELQQSRRAALNLMEDTLKAQESLRRRSAQYETLLQRAPLGVYLVDGDFRIRDVNPVAARVFGYIPDLLGRSFDDVMGLLWPQEYADEIARIFRHTLETGESYYAPERAEFRIDRGIVEYYEWRVDRIPLPEGGHGVVCYFRDISGHVLARQAIAGSEARYRTLFDSIDEGFCSIEVLFDADEKPVDYRFLQVSPSFERQTGIETPVGKTMREISPRHEDQWFEIYGRVALTGEPVRFESHAEQLGRWYDVYAFRVEEPELRRVGVLFNDISERKRAEILAAVQKDVLELIATGRSMDECFHALTSAVSRLHPKARAAVLLADAHRSKIERVISSSVPSAFAEAIEGMPIDETAIGTCSTAIRTGKPVTCADIVQSEHRSQQWKDLCVAHNLLACHSTPVFSAEKTVIALFVVFFASPHEPDAWERRLGELGARIANIVIERERAAQALRELDRRKDEFLANMSHEIRSPLTGIMGYADILESKLTDPEDVACLRTIKQSGDYLIEIVNDILDLSKIEAGKLVLNIETVPVQVVLGEVQSLMAVRAKQKKLSLSLRCVGALPATIQTDRTRLRQILINLASNAIKFTDEGAVEILARTSVDERLLVVEVSDTGIGIAPEHHKLLFQPFTQADTTSTREYGGTGLGLVISKRLVEMLGGSIIFESEPGKGSVFRIMVPIDIAAAPKRRSLLDDSTVRPIDSSLENRRVLVIDDREEICYLVSRYVRAAGGRTEKTMKGEKALEVIAAAADTDPFDAVVLDIQMPGMDGYQVLRNLRSGGFGGPVIALTAGAMVGDRERCLRAGFNDYMTKPIDRQKLVQLLARRTRGGRAERA